VGALRVHPHKHCANYPPQKIEETGLSRRSDLDVSLAGEHVRQVVGFFRDRILLTGASTTYVVKKLEERGLMRRRASAEDSRVVFGELTAKGRALIDDVFPAHVERLQRAMSGLSVTQKRDAIRLLRTLSVHARRNSGEPVTEGD
jgi:MarR family 2-MHQ and catechol resistance regulon transcriptional repressor